METHGENVGPSNRRIPVATFAFILVSVAVHLALAFTDIPPERLGAIDSSAVWDGAYWGLVSSTFVHFDILHIAFNLYWMWVLGRVLEARIGPVRMVVFYVASAFVSSSMELAVSGDQGIGMSGVGYAIFGYMWASRGKYEEFRAAVSGLAGLFVGWAVLCIVLTHFDVLNIANVAHFSGLAFGGLVGLADAASSGRRLAGAGAATLIALSIVPLFWAPWSVDWVSHRAYKAHGEGRWTAAANGYRRALEMGAAPDWALYNLCLVYHVLGDKKRFQATYAELEAHDANEAGRLARALEGD